MSPRRNDAPLTVEEAARILASSREDRLAYLSRQFRRWYETFVDNMPGAWETEGKPKLLAFWRQLDSHPPMLDVLQYFEWIARPLAAELRRIERERARQNGGED